MMTDTIKTEYKLIADGQAFWCETCLCARPNRLQSPDPRYCTDCYAFLCHELELMLEHGATKRPSWIPNPLPEALRAMLPPSKDGQKACDTGITQSTVMSPSVTGAGSNRAVPYNAKVASDALDAAIAALAGKGLGCRAISEALFLQEVDIGYRSVARRLQKAREGRQ
jgi:hypothetical protein